MALSNRSARSSGRVVEVHDQQQPNHERTVDQGEGILAQARAAVLFQRVDTAQQIVRPLRAQNGVVRIDAGIRLPHHRRDLSLALERLHRNFAEVRAKRGPPAPIRDCAAGHDDTHLLAPAH